MKKIIVFFLLATLTTNAPAQKRRAIDSLNKLISKATADTTKALLYCELGQLYSHTRPDTDVMLQEKAMQLIQSPQQMTLMMRDKSINVINIIRYPKYEAIILNSEGIAYYNAGNYPKALNCYISALKLNEKLKQVARQAENLNNIANVYDTEGDYRQAIEIELKEKSLAESIHSRRQIAFALTQLGDFYMDLKKCDSALFYEQQAYRLSLQIKNGYLSGGAALGLGTIYLARNHPHVAISYFRKGIVYQRAADDIINLSSSQLQIAKAFKQLGMSDSSVFYARKATAVAIQGHFIREIFNASEFLADYFKDRLQIDSAFYYQEIALTTRDSLYNQEKTKRIMQLAIAEQERENEAAMQAIAYHSAMRFYLMLIVVVFLLVLAAVFWFNNLKNKKARRLLQKQKEQINTTLDELKTTQNQLVQAAKMASLGELTAGIAHEIQNPLNFVNNFSEVSVEMIAELDEGLEQGDVAEARLIAKELKQNLEKIQHHGRRADSIVKGMLEHSRASSGQKEATDINLLVDECLRLAYHGMRAKDKSFNTEMVTGFGEKLPKVKVVPQDVGRVLLNIFNNAFYAVNQKAKNAGPDYKPTIEVNTLLKVDSVVISIKDNGTGIPEGIREKIMQPFFTTKPTGEGTGLGLSLSYDIIVKGHNGKIELNTDEGQGSEFIISIPV